MALVLLQGDGASPWSVETFWEIVKVVGPIVAGALSGWGLALWQSNVRRREQIEQINQERKALLLLVKSEVIANTKRIEGHKLTAQKVLELYKSSQAEPHSDIYARQQQLESLSKNSGRAAARNITTATWDSTKVRLAQLLQAAEVDVLLIYYDELLSLLPHLPHIDFHDKSQLEPFLPRLEELLETSKTVLEDLERIEDKYEFNR